MTCPKCNADRSELEVVEHWRINMDDGDTWHASNGPDKERDQRMFSLRCNSCESYIAQSDVTNDRDEIEYIDGVMNCTHPERTNSLSMGTRPSDHLDAYRVTVSCDRCGMNLDGDYACRDKDGNIRIA